jgi:hypothetical protein
MNRFASNSSRHFKFGTIATLVKCFSHFAAIVLSMLILTSEVLAAGNFDARGGPLFSDPSCTGTGGGGVICGVVGTNDALRVNRFNGTTWSGFVSLGGVVIGKPSCTYTGNVGAQGLCAVIGTDGSVFVIRFNGVTWSGFQRLVQADGSVLRSISDPACTGIQGTNQVICAMIGVNSALYVNRFDGANWSGFVSLGGAHLFNPTCTEDLTFGGALCGAATTAGQLRVRRFNGTSWAPAQLLNPHSLITADPSCTSVAQLQFVCGVRGANNSLFVSRFDAVAWLPFQNLGGVLTSKPSCTPYNTLSATPKVICAARDLFSQLLVTVSSDGDHWNALQRRTGINMTGDPSCTLLGGTHALCGVRGTDNQLYTDPQTEMEVSVTAPPSAAIQPASLSVTRTGAGDFFIDANAAVTNGQPPFTFSWVAAGFNVDNPTGSTATISTSLVLCDSLSGTAALTVTDALGRTASASAHVSFTSKPPAGKACP